MQVIAQNILWDLIALVTLALSIAVPLREVVVSSSFIDSVHIRCDDRQWATTTF